MSKDLQILKKRHIKQQYGESSIFLKIEIYLLQWEEMEILEFININILNKDNLKINQVNIFNLGKPYGVIGSVE